MSDIDEAQQPVAVISGMGQGLGEALNSILLDSGYKVVGLSREHYAPKTTVSGYVHMQCDVTDTAAVQSSVECIRHVYGPISVIIHNAMELLIGPLSNTSTEDFERVWRVVCLGAFNLATATLPAMAERKCGTLIMTGATAGIRGGAPFSAFASAKFALRGLSQSLAREYAPKGVHIIHSIIDGLIWSPQTGQRFDQVLEENCLDPYDIAATYMHLIKQSPSAWTQEIDIRPWTEKY